MSIGWNLSELLNGFVQRPKRESDCSKIVGQHIMSTYLAACLLLLLLLLLFVCLFVLVDPLHDVILLTLENLKRTSRRSFNYPDLHL